MQPVSWITLPNSFKQYVKELIKYKYKIKPSSTAIYVSGTLTPHSQTSWVS